jgi:hypothetical protein
MIVLLFAHVFFVLQPLLSAYVRVNLAICIVQKMIGKAYREWNAK